MKIRSCPRNHLHVDRHCIHRLALSWGEIRVCIESEFALRLVFPLTSDAACSIRPEPKSRYDSRQYAFLCLQDAYTRRV